MFNPLKPKEWPFFYGYLIVVCTIVGVIMSAPGQTIGISVFTDSLISSLGVSRLTLSTAYMIGTILSSLFIVKLGAVVDHRGSRMVAAVSALGLGATLVLLSQIDRVAAGLTDVIGVASQGAVAFASMTIAFALVRFFGQGALTLASRTMLMHWFKARRGRMNSVAGVATALVFSAAPWAFEMLIQSYGWRGAWWVMAAVVGLGMSTFAALFFRDTPESCGLEPDGLVTTNLAVDIRETTDSTEQSVTEGKAIEAVAEERSWTVAEAKQTYTFWVFNFGAALIAFYNTALMFHIVSVFGYAGFDRALAISIFVPSAVLSISLNLLAGWLADRYKPLKFHLLTVTLGIVLSGLGVLTLSHGLGLWLVIAGQGTAGGMFATLTSVTWPRFFGRTHVGALSGFSMAMMVFASAIGPFLFGLSEKVTRSYHSAVILSVVAAVALGIASLRADPPWPGDSRGG